MDDTLLLIDFNNIFYSFIKLTNLSLSWNGRSVTGIYGFVTQFTEQVNAIKPKHVIICADRKPYIRSQIFPEYKSNRAKETDPEVIKDHRFNRDKCKELLGSIGLPLWSEPGLEADDLISIACNKYQNKFSRIVISSNDSDLYQLLENGNIYIRKKIKHKHRLYSLKDFKEEFEGITTRQYIKYLAIKGTHNAVPGIYGIGHVKALKIVKDERLLKELYLQHGEILKLYERLIKLPYHTEAEPPELNKINYNERRVMRFLFDLGMDMTKNMSKAFSSLSE